MKQYLNECDNGFNDVILSDEASIQCETHKYHKKGCRFKGKPRQVLLVQ